MNKPNWSQASVSSRCSIESDLFEKSWELSNIYMTHSRKGNISLIEKAGYAYFLGSTSLNDYEALVKIDMENGAIIWKSNQNRSFLNPRPSTMASNDDLIYVGFSSKSKVSGENMKGASEIIAFRILDGEEVWKSKVGGARNIATIISADSFVNVDGSYSSSFYAFDPLDGEILEIRDKLEGYKLYAEDNIVYERHLTSDLKAVEQQSGEVLWVNDLPDYMRRPPVFIEDIILIRTGESLGDIIALEKSTGRTLWELGNIVSNIATDGSNVFVLTKDASLLRIDLESGDVQARLDLGSESLKDIVNYGYYVVANKETIVIYLGDSRELCAFHFNVE